MSNPTDHILRLSGISYNVTADNVTLANGNLSYEDVPFNARPALLAGQFTNVNSTFQVHHSDSIDNILFDKIRSDPSSVKWRLTGNFVVVNSLTEADVQFNDTK
jgi:LEA14-like dessication related protein